MPELAEHVLLLLLLLLVLDTIKIASAMKTKIGCQLMRLWSSTDLANTFSHRDSVTRMPNTKIDRRFHFYPNRLRSVDANDFNALEIIR